MRQINIEFFNDKSVKINDANLGNKLDNLVSQINFIFDSCTFHENLIYNYFAIKNELKEDYTLIDISNNKSIIIDSEFTKTYLNNNTCLVILSDKEILDYIDNDRTNFVSNSFNLYITNNYLTDDNIKILENKEAI